MYLSEALDALDRLYDDESGAVDVAAILNVGGTALSDRDLGQRLVSTAEQLRSAVRAARPQRLSNEEALHITDVVRVPISEAWGELSPPYNS